MYSMNHQQTQSLRVSEGSERSNDQNHKINLSRVLDGVGRKDCAYGVQNSCSRKIASGFGEFLRLCKKLSPKMIFSFNIFLMNLQQTQSVRDQIGQNFLCWRQGTRNIVQIYGYALLWVFKLFCTITILSIFVSILCESIPEKLFYHSIETLWERQNA